MPHAFPSEQPAAQNLTGSGQRVFCRETSASAVLVVFAFAIAVLRFFSPAYDGQRNAAAAVQADEARDPAENGNDRRWKSINFRRIMA